MIEYIKSKSKGLSCPIAIFAIGLLILQLVLFNIGVIFFNADYDKSINTNHISREDVEREQLFPKEITKPADGTFNGYPIYFQREKNVETIPHCVGENYHEKKSWQKKSCEFSNLFCFDTAKKDFVVFKNIGNEQMYKHA